MQPDYWHRRWERNQIGFHEGAANAFLVKHIDALGLSPGQRVFLPLCGKTLDIPWLLHRGYRVAGAELSSIAIEQLFAESGVVPQVATAGDLVHFHAPDLDIFVGDVFQLSRSALGPVDALYDRAALVALPPEMRLRYAAHLAAITDTAPQLLITFEYDQRLMDGPPFSVSEAEVHRLYGERFAITQLESAEMPDGLKGQYAAIEQAWLLRRARAGEP